MPYTLQPKETQDNLEVIVPDNATKAHFTCDPAAWANLVSVLRFKLGNVDTNTGGPSAVSTFGARDVNVGQRCTFGLRSGADVAVTVSLVFT